MDPVQTVPLVVLGVAISIAAVIHRAIAAWEAVMVARAENDLLPNGWPTHRVRATDEAWEREE